VRRWALLIIGGAVWLVLAAVPALADGGPHVLTNNNGSLGLNADGCAGCHRAHTAQGPYLIKAASDEALCLTCHGAIATGSTVDVMTGVQYTLRGAGGVGGTQLGALRGGGFDLARIGAPARLTYERAAGSYSQRPKVTVGPPLPVNSAHLALPENGLTNPGIAWGNGANGSGAGPAVTLGCASCHNPHGNGMYRILNPIPNPIGTGFVAAATPANVTDAALPLAGDTRNYTVIQTAAAPIGPGYLLTANQVTAGGYSPTDGDYFHRYVPWNATSAGSRAYDAPNGRPATFGVQMGAWCTTCHTRYTSFDAFTPRQDALGQDDPIYRYQHQTVAGGAFCTTCHVAHGSNTPMAGTFSGAFAYPGDATTSGSSRLLKFTNRGTCQACHDPTGTIAAGAYTGPDPSPGVP